jgi:predicted DNA-binding transcriptional regulator AlpA
MTSKLLTVRQLRDVIGLPWSTRTIQRKCRAGEFPKPKYLAKSPLWLEDEVRNFIKLNLKDTSTYNPHGTRTAS